MLNILGLVLATLLFVPTALALDNNDGSKQCAATVSELEQNDELEFIVTQLGEIQNFEGSWKYGFINAVEFQISKLSGGFQGKYMNGAFRPIEICMTNSKNTLQIRAYGADPHRPELVVNVAPAKIPGQLNFSVAGGAPKTLSNANYKPVAPPVIHSAEAASSGVM